MPCGHCRYVEIFTGKRLSCGFIWDTGLVWRRVDAVGIDAWRGVLQRRMAVEWTNKDGK
jgi:hypothetical protein